MKLLFVVRSIDSSRGGIERNTNTLFRYFESCGIECYCIYTEIPVEDSRIIPEARRMRVDPKSDRKALTRICLDFIERNGIDVILNRGVYFSFLIDLYERLRKDGKCRIIHSFHSSPEDMNFYHKLPFFHNRIYRRRAMYRVCDRFVLLSPSYIESAVREFRLPDRNKLTVIANPQPFEGLVLPDLCRKKKQVLIVSRLDDAQKNLRAAIRIWKDIEERGADGWELVVAGHGEDEKSLLRYAGRMGLEHFRFLGRSSNPVALYQESSIFMMTSRFEGFPTTLQEALMNGCVPMAFDSFSAVHDMIEDGHDGLIIGFGDEKGYADALYRLMRDDGRRVDMARAGMEGRGWLKVEVIGGQWIKLFNELIG